MDFVHRGDAEGARRNPLPKRGQVKARIVRTLFRSVVAIGSETQGSGHSERPNVKRSASASPSTLSGYASDVSSDE
ncbi:unnamed protein product [Spirodela intermedia]|uniref:Uncharacterized protein n=2 Tax=Spirodela intermedia TaxID=51605 RepID=A0A7I8IGF7_SPIIN|nr:unnamed protein product [Spirodela intermedia]CAA6656861.1 unnamed protein product [Spirodela intermedia]CAA7392814.1 unnamed protein product [Spirodela intermedia]